MPARTLAIGDIHGCSAALERLLEEVQPQAEDTLITLGDYIDRGPNSRRVLEIMCGLGAHCRLISLKGNHEVLMLMALESPSNMQFWLQSGGLATLSSYGGVEAIPSAHVEFVRSCLHYHETATHLFVHANYHPFRELAEQTEQHLFWEHLHYLLPEPHISRKKVIVGHTPQRNGEVLDCGHVVCIDTYCFGTGWLTAYDVDSGQTWQADKFGKVRGK